METKEIKDKNYLMTANDVACYLRVSRSCFQKMVADGEFPQAPYRVRGRRRWPRKLVDEWIESQRNTVDGTQSAP